MSKNKSKPSVAKEKQKAKEEFISYQSGSNNIIPSWREVFKKVLPIFLISRIPVLFGTWVTSIFWPAKLPAGHELWHGVIPPQNAFLNLFCRWDANWYLNIVQNGYQFVADKQNNTAFFFIYPTLIKIFSYFFDNPIISGLFVSNLAFILALSIMYRLICMDENTQIAYRATLFLAVYPTAFLYSGIYSESTFLLFIILSFYFFRQEKWLSSGIAGALAAGTRLIGVALIPAFAARIIKNKINNTWRIYLALLIICLGIISFMLVLKIQTGDALAFIHSEKYWTREFSLPYQSLLNSFEIITEQGFFSSPQSVRNGFDLIFTLLFLALLPFIFRDLGLTYGVFCTLGVLIPMCSSHLYSMPRYTMTLFPFFILLARWSSNIFIERAYLISSSLLLGLISSLHEQWLISL